MEGFLDTPQKLALASSLCRMRKAAACLGVQVMTL